MTLPFHHYQPETTSLHGGQTPDPSTGSRAIPIHQTTSYVFRDTEHAQNLFALAEPGNIYTRITNPTLDVFEQRVALLEDGVAAVCTSSGMAAITLAILNIAGAGDNIVASSNIYGGTYNLFAVTLPKYGIDVTFIDGNDANQFQAAIKPNTKAIFAEVIGNPSLEVLDIEAVADVAHACHVPFIVDSTFATPYVCKPISWGADIVVHSATKWIGGHGNSIGGVVVDGGRFNWNHEKFPGFTEPDLSYHGLRYGIDVGPAAFAVKLRVQLLRDIGACLSPQNAFYLLQGLETLPVRMERHLKNAEEIATYLEAHQGVEWVSYPGLENHPSHELASKYLRGGYGSMVVFGIKGGREEGRTVIDHIQLWSHVANVGDAKSLIIHPASTTHQQLNEQELVKSGVTEDLIRLSVGLESPKDLIADLEKAIKEATGFTSNAVPTELSSQLLASSLHRDEQTIRKKKIAIFGGDRKSKHVEIVKLERLGFEVVVEKEALTNDVDIVYALNSTAVLKAIATFPIAFYCIVRDTIDPYTIEQLTNTNTAYIEVDSLYEEIIKHHCNKQTVSIGIN
ncbi:O-acetylhomoserine aminocarboxypropyltransferase/cysteine synthase family protein [Pontibacillus litoralis]|uniref:O-acetylhomoserine sulfhydrylase n=1 Tax=Pontibacillus litoralis JSM 072002 TaxID=1385512 RepID=A0A0A5HT84_9BACI|nr:O-acetylhomoserine aminocarboxypropyltransferase/cysteine synthase family protein [Pontibacillus litoralis]KGX86842.1 O-acetylhomoserine sulfhydrylase [Pontibacillus litoralis JSM 072002]